MDNYQPEAAGLRQRVAGSIVAFGYLHKSRQKNSASSMLARGGLCVRIRTAERHYGWVVGNPYLIALRQSCPLERSRRAATSKRACRKRRTRLWADCRQSGSIQLLPRDSGTIQRSTANRLRTRPLLRAPSDSDRQRENQGFRAVLASRISFTRCPNLAPDTNGRKPWSVTLLTSFVGASLSTRWTMTRSRLGTIRT